MKLHTDTDLQAMLSLYEGLCTRHDDLKYTLLKFGGSLGDTLPVVQEEYHKVRRKLERLEAKMAATERFAFPGTAGDATRIVSPAYWSKQGYLRE